MSRIILAQLAMTGRVTMLGIFHWTEEHQDQPVSTQ